MPYDLTYSGTKSAKQTSKQNITRAIEIKNKVLAGMAQWIEHWPTNQKITGSSPSQGPCLGCKPDPYLWCV